MKPIHRKRLKKLAEYLLTQVPEKRFDMSMFRVWGDREHICGSAGCALGWSPAIMDKRTFQKYKDENGSQAISTMFDAISEKYFGVEIDIKWSYLFSSSWCHVDNTPQGAGARILYLLDHGVPYYFIRGGDPSNWDVSHYQKYLTKKQQ